MIEAIEVRGLTLLPGCRHGVEGPTALVSVVWQGDLADGEFALLQERLAHALWFLERLWWKQSQAADWRAYRSVLPERVFPGDFLVGEPAGGVAALLAAGITAMQWGTSLPVSKARVLPGADGAIALAVPYWLRPALEASLELTRRLLLEGSAAIATPDPDAPDDWRPALEALVEAAAGSGGLERDGLWMATLAQRRGLPLARLDFGVVEIGYGRGRRRFLGSLEGGDAVAAVQASNKLVIKRQLQRAGVPVPDYRLVGDEQQTLEAAQELGWPVVLKPIDRSQSQGVTANIWRVPDLLRAYRNARKVSQQPLLLERHVVGDDHRILVLDGRVVAAAVYRHVAVRGDGFRSLGQLIEAARIAGGEEEAHRYVLNGPVRRGLDAQGLGLEDVVESGRLVRLRLRRGEPPFPSTMVDVLDQLHPQLARLAVRATAALGVRLAGLDLITPEASQHPLEAGAMVLELNPRPNMETLRFTHPPRDTDRQVFEIGCPVGYRSIPVVLLDGGATGERLSGALEQALTPAFVGRWSGEQISFGGQPEVWVQAADSPEAPGQLVLSDGRVEVALLNLPAAGWQAAGFPCSRCPLGVLGDGGEALLEAGLLAEWVSVVHGTVVVVAGSEALETAVRQLVGERLLAVADEAAALAALQAAVREHLG